MCLAEYKALLQMHICFVTYSKRVTIPYKQGALSHIYIYIYIYIYVWIYMYIERSGSGVELWTLDYESPGSNPGCGVKTLGKFFHSTLLQFTQLNK